MFVAYGNPDTGDPNDATGAKQIAEERGYEVVLGRPVSARHQRLGTDRRPGP